MTLSKRNLKQVLTKTGEQFSGRVGAMRFLIFLIFLDISTACCCSWSSNLFRTCGCNIFGCNCDTVQPWGTCLCDSSEHCPDRRRRKRSLHNSLMEAYSGLYPSNLIDQAAMEKFFSFDTNLDGLISLQEVMEKNGSNETEEGFKQVDLDKDGFVKPSEFDLSLN